MNRWPQQPRSEKFNGCQEIRIQRTWTAPTLAEQDILNAELLAEKERLAQRTREYLKREGVRSKWRS